MSTLFVKPISKTRKRCTVEGCKSHKIVGPKPFCRLHGGGPRCQQPECTSSAVSGGLLTFTLCTLHGGGPRRTVGAAKLRPEQEDCAENTKEADYAQCQSVTPQHKDPRYAIFMVVAQDVRLLTAVPTLTETGGARNICTLQCIQRSELEVAVPHVVEPQTRVPPSGHNLPDCVTILCSLSNS